MRAVINKLTSGLLLGLLVAPFPAEPQPPAKQVRIGYLSGESEPTPTSRPFTREAFFETLGQHGWAQGTNLSVESRYAAGAVETLPRLASELAASRVDLIVVLGSTPAALAAKRATTTIPVVFTSGTDPVAFGIVESLARPGGNVTGLGTSLTVVQKRLEILREVTPNATRYAFLTNPSNPIHLLSARELAVAASRSRLGLIVVEVTDPPQLDDAFARIRRERTGGVVVLGDPIFGSHMNKVVALAAQARVPISVPSSYYVRHNGALVSYAVDHVALARRAGALADRILRGALPAEIPVEQATKFELVINMRTAKALGLKLSPSLRLRADEVIE